MKTIYIRVSKTGYMKGWGTRWIGGLSPIERRLVKSGHFVLIHNGVPKVKGLPMYRVVKYYGRYGYCPRVVSPAYRSLADRAMRLYYHYEKNRLLHGHTRGKCASYTPF